MKCQPAVLYSVWKTSWNGDQVSRHNQLVDDSQSRALIEEDMLDCLMKYKMLFNITYESETCWYRGLVARYKQWVDVSQSESWLRMMLACCIYEESTSCFIFHMEMINTDTGN